MIIDDSTFAAACYDQNTIAELESALHAPADRTDMRTWGLTAGEYYAQIKLALAAKRADSHD
jgi:hypothetical protein